MTSSELKISWSSNANSMHLALNEISQSVIEKTLAMCAYMYAKENHAFAEKAHKLGLLNARIIFQFREFLEEDEKKTNVEFSRRQAIQFYSLLDLCCKAYLCGIGDRLTLATGTHELAEGTRVRNYYLSQAEVLLAGMKQGLVGDEEFAEIQYKLWQLNTYLID